MFSDRTLPAGASDFSRTHAVDEFEVEIEIEIEADEDGAAEDEEAGTDA